LGDWKSFAPLKKLYFPQKKTPYTLKSYSPFQDIQKVDKVIKEKRSDHVVVAYLYGNDMYGWKE
jgi:hypothetical protein